MAAITGNLETLGALVRRKVDVRAVGPSGFSSLHWAAIYNKEVAIDTLIAAGADVNAKSAFGGQTPLHGAVICGGTPETIAALFRHGADAGALDGRGDPPLHLASIHGKKSVIAALAAAGTDINRRTSKNGLTALDWAAYLGNVDVLKMLVENGADVRGSGPRGDTPLHFAVKRNTVGASEASCEATTALLLHGAEVDAADNFGETPLVIAVKKGKLALVEALVAGGADVNRRNVVDDMAPLDVAAFIGNLEVLKALLGYGSRAKSVDSVGATALHHVAAIGVSEASCEAITALLLHGAEVDAADKNGETPLVIAVKKGKLALVDALVAGGADVNRRNVVDDMAPLDVAAFIGNLEVLKALLGYGSRAKSVNSVGATALHHVVAFEAADLVHALADAGADASAENTNGMMPIHNASIRGSPTAIMSLTQRGADTEARTKSGLTPLQLAAECGKVSAIDALAAAGADINLRTTTNDTSALDLAAQNGEVDAMNALIRNGANVRAGNASGYTAL